jgi:hypothetical protein
MTMTQWLLQSNHPNLSSIREIEAILCAQGNDVRMIALKGHSAEIPDIGTLDLTRPVVCYGPSFVPRTLRCSELSPGIFFDPATFRWSAFHEGWGELMLSAGAAIVCAMEAPSRIGAKLMFVRPDEDSKAFDGCLFDAASLKALIVPAVEKGLIHLETPVVMAEPIRIDAEWRTFIVDRQVVAASSYRKNGAGNIDLHVPRHVIDLAFEAAELWTPADVFCLDIALAGERYGIVEANCFNASRFYGADANAILNAVSAFVSNKFAMSAPGKATKP